MISLNIDFLKHS